MLKYFTENELPNEDIQMDVQVGPQEEVEAQVGDKAEEISAVDLAKKNPETVLVVGVKSNEIDACEKDHDEEIREGEKVGEEKDKTIEVKTEFFVDGRDVAKYAELNEKTMLESLDDIIEVNEALNTENLTVVMTESVMNYAPNLEKNGVRMQFIKENEDETEEPDIEMDVQIGPQEDEVTVKEDPQTANPVDAVKRQYDSVVVAKDGDDFFVDVEDTQKCAELNCESVIDTLNGIINVHPEWDLNTENLHVVAREGAEVYSDVVEDLQEAGVLTNF